jgi:hypothetical protein
MSKKIIFYGGCQGINKSQRLTEAVKLISESSKSDSFEIIRFSDSFENAIRNSGQAVEKNTNTLWYEVNWKQHEEDVVKSLISKIVSEDKINIINNHFSVPYMGKDNYVPGLEQDNLKKLLYGIFYNKAKELINAKNCPCFGVLLIEPEPMLIDSNYKEMYYNCDFQTNNNNIKILHYLNTLLNYVSENEIKKDLEQNRIWAQLYRNTASSILGEKYVRYETIYITKNLIKDGFVNINRKIADFFKLFNN